MVVTMDNRGIGSSKLSSLAEASKISVDIMAEDVISLVNEVRFFSANELNDPINNNNVLTMV